MKHEFLGGQIFAMAGGTPEHATLTTATIGLLFAQLCGGECRAFDADLRVHVVETGRATYPDVTVVCGRRETDVAADGEYATLTAIGANLGVRERYDAAHEPSR